jgi:citrate lyase beta subunit
MAALEEAEARGDGAVNAGRVLVDLAHAKQAGFFQARARRVAQAGGAQVSVTGPSSLRTV